MTQQELERDFFEKLGRAIGKWQLVETQLFRVYARLVRCEEGAIAAAAFHAIRGFRNRLNVTQAAAMAKHASSPNSSELDDWKRLHKNAVKQSQVRNQFAHHTVYFVIGSPDPEEAGPFLGRSYFDPNPKADDERRRVRDLVRAAASFDTLAEEMRTFANSLPVPPGSPPLV